MPSRTTGKVIDLGAPALGAAARTEAALALRAPTGMLPAVQQELLAHVQTVIAAGLMPSHIKTPEMGVVILLKGRELGMQPMQALASIYVVNGLTSLKTEAMVALALQRVKDLTFEWIESTTQKADVIVRRGRSCYRSVFTMKDAERAGLSGKDMYRKYPQDMLRWRALAPALRLLAPDVMQGTYTTEELIGVASPAEIAASIEAAPTPVAVDPDAPTPEPEGARADEFGPQGGEEEAPPEAPQEKPEPPRVVTSGSQAGKASITERVTTAWRDLVAAVVAAGIHANAPNSQAAAGKWFFQQTGTNFGKRAEALIPGARGEADLAALLADALKARKAAEAHGASRREPWQDDDLPMRR